MITRGQVVLWCNEASDTLASAEETCKAAQKLLEETDHDLHSRLAAAIDASHDMALALQEQAKVMERVLAAMKSWKEEDTSTELKIGRLERELARLNRRVAMLADTVVPAYLLKDPINTTSEDTDDLTKQKTLKDFISHDSVELLEDNANTYVTNARAILGLTDQVKQDVIGRAELYRKQAGRFALQYQNESTGIIVETSVGVRTEGTAFSSRSVAATIDKENSALESELVGLLELLTNHFNQCNQALSLPWSKPEAMAAHQEDLQVLESDTRDLVGVYKELNTIKEIISNNRNRASKYVASKLPSFERIIGGSRNLLDTIRDFKCKTVPHLFAILAELTSLLQTYVINGDTITSGDPLQSYILAIDELCGHYERFAHVFGEVYLAELRQRMDEFPRKFTARITSFLNHDLDELRMKESQRRAEWVKQYGGYIPRQFILPEEVPSVIQVVTDIDELEAANTSSDRGYVNADS